MIRLLARKYTEQKKTRGDGAALASKGSGRTVARRPNGGKEEKEIKW